MVNSTSSTKNYWVDEHKKALPARRQKGLKTKWD